MGPYLSRENKHELLGGLSREVTVRRSTTAVNDCRVLDLGNFTDLAISTNSKQYRVHRGIVCCQSDVPSRILIHSKHVLVSFSFLDPLHHRSAILIPLVPLQHIEHSRDCSITFVMRQRSRRAPRMILARHGRGWHG